jgi:hypothetical protein
MASRKELYENAVSELQRFVPAVNGEEFVRRLLAGTAEAAAANTTVTPVPGDFAGILSSITDLINGGKFTDEIINDIDEFLSSKDVNNQNVLENSEAQRLREFVRFTIPSKRISRNKISTAAGIISGARSFGTKGIGDEKWLYYLPETYSLQKDSAERSKSAPDISVIEILEPRVGTKVRDTTGLSIFSSIIPTHIISRAVPYVAVKVYSSDIVQPRNNGVKTANSFNIIRYLRGYAPIVGETEPTLAMLLQGSSTSAGEPRPGGMELFTMPQTLVSNLDDINDSNLFPVRPVDRFRPLLTLNSLTLDIVSAGAGMMSYKNASMNVTLHDRGRLAEVASLVKPGAYSSTEVEIEYGWSIDPGSKNAKLDEVNKKLTGFALQDDVFSQFVDSLKCKEKFGVTNSSFQFDDAGQVTISLSLFTKGAFEARSYDISAESNKNSAQTIKELLDSINKAISTNATIESMLSESILSAASSDDGGVSLDESSFATLKSEVEKLNKTGGKPSAVVATALSNLIKTSEDVRASGAVAAGDIINELFNEDEIFPPTGDIAQSSDSTTPWKWPGSNTKDYAGGSISLGRLLLRAVALPLSKSSKFDEIQLIFGKINPRAGYVRGLSMAAFPLDKKKLENDIKELYKKNIQVSASMLVALIGQNHVGSVSYPAYGFSAQYDKEGDLVKGGSTKIEEILVNAGIADSKFVMPKLQVNFECVPHVADESKTILRIHVTDESASPFLEYSELVNATRTDGSFLIDSQALNSGSQPGFPDLNTAWADLQPGSIDKNRNSLINELEKRGAIVKAGDKTYRGIDLTKLFEPSSPAAVKRFIAEGLPVIRYGNSAGMIKNISVSSISDPALATINIIKSDESESDSPASTRKKGLPMIVTPTEVTMDMLGCPLINFGQSVYIDFGTGTTVDNIYACTSVTHTFNPGEFSTSAKFIINVGAYGIYNSDRRAVDIAAAKAQQASGEQERPADTAPPTATPENNWETLASGITLTVLNDPKYIDGYPSAIRIWSDPPSGRIKYSFSENSKVEIVKIDSATEREVLEASQPGAYFYEIPYIRSKSSDSIIANVKQKSDSGTITSQIKIILTGTFGIQD